MRLRLGADLGRVDGVARLHLRALFQVLGIDPLQALVLDVGETRLDVLALGHAGAPCLVLGRWHRQRASLLGHPASRLLAERNRLRHALEIRGGDVAHDHVDADVPVRQGVQLQVLVGHDAHVGAAQHQLGRGLQLLAL